MFIIVRTDIGKYNSELHIVSYFEVDIELLLNAKETSEKWLYIPTIFKFAVNKENTIKEEPNENFKYFNKLVKIKKNRKKYIYKKAIKFYNINCHIMVLSSIKP